MTEGTLSWVVAVAVSLVAIALVIGAILGNLNLCIGWCG